MPLREIDKNWNCWKLKQILPLSSKPWYCDVALEVACDSVRVKVSSWVSSSACRDRFLAFNDRLMDIALMDPKPKMPEQSLTICTCADSSSFSFSSSSCSGVSEDQAWQNTNVDEGYGDFPNPILPGRMDWLEVVLAGCHGSRCNSHHEGLGAHAEL